MKGFFSLRPEKKKKRRKLECSLKRRADLGQGNFLSGLFYITVSSGLLQCALTSLNENCMSFASCFLRLGYKEIKLRWISLESSRSRKTTLGNFQILTIELLTALQYCLAIFILRVSPRKKWFNFLRRMVDSTPASFPNWFICGQTTTLPLSPQSESKLWLKSCWFARNRMVENLLNVVISEWWRTVDTFRIAVFIN